MTPPAGHAIGSSLSPAPPISLTEAHGLQPMGLPCLRRLTFSRMKPLNMANSTNLRKAAILLASLPADEAEKLLARFESGQVQALTAELIRLGGVEQNEERAICQEFAAAVSPAPQRDHWSSLPPFCFLRHFDHQALTKLLKHEHPQTVSLIVSYLPRAAAVKFIADLPHEQQADLIHRVSTLGYVDRQIVSEVEIGLQSRLVKSLYPPGESASNAAAA